MTNPRLGMILLALLAALPAGAAQADEPLCPQVANYAIDVRLDTARRDLTGREILTWTNGSPDALSELRFHLYWNAFSNDRTTFMTERLRERDRALDFSKEDWGYCRVKTVKVLAAGIFQEADLTSRLVFLRPDDDNPHDRTVFSVTLPQPLPPGETVTLELEFIAHVPRPISRTGFVHDTYFIAQWFPKVGVYVDGRWNCHQYHSHSEYFADYGTYDVKITVPGSFVVGATGRRLSRVKNGDGTATHRFFQHSVHDFAWTAGPRYLEYSRDFEFSPGKTVRINLLLQPEHRRLRDRYLMAVMNAVKFSSRWYGDYPYATATCVDPAYGSRAGGMEYPTFFTGGAHFLDPEGSGDPEGVTIHEFGHNHFYGLVGNNEFENAWLDEGFTSFLDSEVYEAAYGEKIYTRTFFGIPVLFRQVRIPIESEGISAHRRTWNLDAMQRFSWEFLDGESYSANVYSKAELMLRQLKRTLGPEVFGPMIKDYALRFRFKHPRPEDFSAVVAEHAGRDMSAWLDPFIHGSGLCDYALDSLTVREETSPRGWISEGEYSAGTSGGRARSGRFASEIVVRRLGDIRLPVDILVRFEDGKTVREPWNGQDRWKRFRYTGRARVRAAVVDPDFKLVLDVNRTNNSRLSRPAGLGPWKWAVEWLAWLQHALELATLFGG